MDLLDRLYATFIQDDRYMMFLNGFKTTVIIAVLATIVGVVIGTIVAIGKVYCQQTKRMKWLNVLIDIYLTIFRGTPVVVQLMIWCYVIITAPNMELFTAILAFGINSGAYVAEIVRAGIMGIDKGQTEAGRSLGLTAGQTMKSIVLPQAFKNILPALANELIALLKETSVVGYIAIIDLAKAADLVRSRTFDAMTSLLFIALLYLILVMLLTAGQRALERRLRKSDRS